MCLLIALYACMCVPITFHGLGAGWKRTKIKFQEPIESNPKFLSQSVKEVCECALKRMNGQEKDCWVVKEEGEGREGQEEGLYFIASFV
ncbi:unnamed protein product [Sphagnum jensenii]